MGKLREQKERDTAWGTGNLLVIIVFATHRNKLYSLPEMIQSSFTGIDFALFFTNHFYPLL
jgi:hypothetical protein